MFARRAPSLGPVDLRLDAGDDPLGDLFLDHEHVGHVAVVTLGEQVMAAGRLDELDGDADPIAGPPGAAFDEIGRAQFAADLGAGLELAPVGEGRVFGDDRKPAPVGQRGDDLLGEPVDKIGLGRVVAEIVERHDGDRPWIGKPAPGSGVEAGRRRLDEAPQGLDQGLRVRVETIVGNLHRLARGEALEGRRQGLGRRHPRAVDEQGDDPDIAAQRGLDLDAHIVFGIGQARIGLGAAPARPDQGQQDLAVANALAQDLGEVRARFDALDIDEYLARGKALRQPVEQPPGEAGRVVAPVTDEDSIGHFDCSRRKYRTRPARGCQPGRSAAVPSRGRAGSPPSSGFASAFFGRRRL